MLYIKKCIAHCSSSHSQVCSVAELTTLPTRVLSLEGSDIRLYEAHTTEANFKYAALSHCWGGTCRLQLTQASLKQFKTQIAWGLLPEVFQDAITVARKLDIPFLWIDSLCIIQDRTSDWEQEAAKMGGYYQNVYLMIVVLLLANLS